MPLHKVEIYTDGSCHTQHCLGAWVALVFIAGEKITLSGNEQNTTHNRMELTAVIKALQYVQQQNAAAPAIAVVTDSQYVTGLQARGATLLQQGFTTKKGTLLTNAGLVKTFLHLIHCMPVAFVKIKAHQKRSGVINYNIEADMLCRNMVRLAVKERWPL